MTQINCLTHGNKMLLINEHIEYFNRVYQRYSCAGTCKCNEHIVDIEIEVCIDDIIDSEKEIKAYKEKCEKRYQIAVKEQKILNDKIAKNEV